MSYATKQRTRLFVVLKAHSDATLSVERIVSLCGDGEVSRSAVYRNLASLEREGLVKRVPLPAPQKNGYRFVGTDECKKHLHLSCSLCGRTFHLALPASESVIDGVMQTSDFQIDLANTVLTGVCGECRKSGSNS